MTDPTKLAMARRLAEHRQRIAERSGGPAVAWTDLTEQERQDSTLIAQHYLDAAAAAGLAIADAGVTTPAADTRPARVTAMVEDLEGNPIPRDEYAEQLQARLDLAGGIRTRGAAVEDRTITIPEALAEVAAELLDELAGVYPREPLGRLARSVAVFLYDRLGL